MTDHEDLIRKLMEAGVEYRASSRYGGFDSPPSVQGYDYHGSTNLTYEEEDLLREVLGMPVQQLVPCPRCRLHLIYNPDLDRWDHHFFPEWSVGAGLGIELSRALLCAVQAADEDHGTPIPPPSVCNCGCHNTPVPLAQGPCSHCMSNHGPVA